MGRPVSLVFDEFYAVGGCTHGTPMHLTVWNGFPVTHRRKALRGGDCNGRPYPVADWMSQRRKTPQPLGPWGKLFSIQRFSHR